MLNYISPKYELTWVPEGHWSGCQGSSCFSCQVCSRTASVQTEWRTLHRHILRTAPVGMVFITVSHLNKHHTNSKESKLLSLYHLTSVLSSHQRHGKLAVTYIWEELNQPTWAPRKIYNKTSATYSLSNRYPYIDLMFYKGSRSTVVARWTVGQDVEWLILHMA